MRHLFRAFALGSILGVASLGGEAYALRVTGEHEYPVPPLSCPDVRHLPTVAALTQYEAVALFAQPRPGAPAPDSDALLERFGLAYRRRYAFGSMSGGERQRLFLVLALLNTPRLVILDELTQGLDPTARRDVWAAVDQLRDVGTTVLLVTHELVEAEALCDRVIAMRDGKVLAAGTPAELVRRFAGAATVSFTWTPGDHLDLARDLNRLNRIEGVTRVRRNAGRVIVDGDVPVIAHVGAWLAASDQPVPPDLRVDQPGLEDALLTLLDSPRAA